MKTQFLYEEDGFHGKLYLSSEKQFEKRALILFSGSDGRFELACMLAEKFCQRGVNVLALAYVYQAGLPQSFYQIPIDMLEKAADYLHENGFEKVGLWGISKGAELALVAASLLPQIQGVIAVAPMSIVCQGFEKKRGIRIMPGSSWSFHQKEIPYTPFGFKRLPMGKVLIRSLQRKEISMLELYQPMIDHPKDGTVIPVEKIQGAVLLISSRMDTMWPSQNAAEKIMARLKENEFRYPYQHLCYDYGSHLFIPMKLNSAKFFKADRKYPEQSKKAYEDSFEKTLQFIAAW